MSSDSSSYAIPDVPKDVHLHLQRNYYVSKAEAQKHEDEKLHTKEYHEVKKKLGELRDDFFSRSAAPLMSPPIPTPRKTKRRPVSDTFLDSQSRTPLLLEEEGSIETPR